MKISEKKEEIILDATLLNELECATFQVELDNGHKMVAFSAPKKTLSQLKLRLGQRVRLHCSPYDMLKGIILEDHPQDLKS
ncbi:translation initiation factor IF-1 [Kiritimatiellaeota bacterium B1221]|nr:translation initiation factor IF-1 [Kiritimatiellaeota bacterium B1221]